MKERPILFQGWKVRKIQEWDFHRQGNMQTRRVIKPQPPGAAIVKAKTGIDYGIFTDASMPGYRVTGPVGVVQDLMGFGKSPHWLCPYGQPGDRLWVRETHITGFPCEGGELQCYDEYGNELPKHVWYKADGGPCYMSQLGEEIQGWYNDQECFSERIPWKPSIHMFRWASRTDLGVMAVRVERVQDISEDDAKAEGIDARPQRAKPWFRDVWDSINASPKPKYVTVKGRRIITHYESYPWEEGTYITAYRGEPWYVYGNPWNWVVEFGESSQ